MRLYSRSQLLIVSLASIIVGLFVAIGVGFIPVKGISTDRTGEAPSGTAQAKIGESRSQSSAQLVPADTFSQFNLDEKENIDVYERLHEGVVNITTEIVAINWFLEPVPKEGGSGSGVIIDERGYVLTNYHVVKDAFKVFISLADGTRFDGKVLGSDSENDLAIVKFDPPKALTLTIVPYGDSASLKVGQKVLAIGNPFGLDATLTAGIVSGLGRPVQQDARTVIRDMIQTDASINPGNSGGPLLNSHGEIIGINTMIYSPSGGSVGVGFAVPVNTAKRVVPELIKYGMVKRGWIETELVQIFPSLVEYMKEKGSPLPVEKGMLVSIARKGGNADRGGIRGGSNSVRYGQSIFNIGGDVIVSVDGMAVASIADLYSSLEDNKPGETVKVEYYRGGKKILADVVLSDRAEYMKSK